MSGGVREFQNFKTAAPPTRPQDAKVSKSLAKSISEMIFIVGCDHKHQRRQQSCGGDGIEAFEREQKNNFAEFVGRLTNENKVALIAEEINQGEDTFARDIASSRNCRYVNIDMSEQQRRTAGIPRSYSDNREGHTQEEIEKWDASREAALYALMRFPNLRMRGRIFDEDTTAASNLNRNMLTVVTDIGSPKVQVVAQRCGTKLQLQPAHTRFVGASFEGTLANRVLVGVDDIPSRWEIQRHARGWVTVSGTSHFNVSSSSHNPGAPCAGCLHPVDDPAGANPIPTISFVSFWAGLAMAVRLLREVVAAPYSSQRQHLWLTPLRMDLPYSAMWLPVAPRSDCPVHCVASLGFIASLKSKRVSAGQS